MHLDRVMCALGCSHPISWGELPKNTIKPVWFGDKGQWGGFSCPPRGVGTPENTK